MALVKEEEFLQCETYCALKCAVLYQPQSIFWGQNRFATYFGEQMDQTESSRTGYQWTKSDRFIFDNRVETKVSSVTALPGEVVRNLKFKNYILLKSS